MLTLKTLTQKCNTNLLFKTSPGGLGSVISVSQPQLSILKWLRLAL